MRETSIIIYDSNNSVYRVIFSTFVNSCVNEKKYRNLIIINIITCMELNFIKKYFYTLLTIPLSIDDICGKIISCFFINYFHNLLKCK